MAISTFSELKTAIANWLNRSDLTSVIPDFIALAEARMNRDSRMRVGEAVVNDTIDVVASDQYADLPSDFARMINLEREENGIVVALEPLSPQQMDAVRAQDPAGPPSFYCILGAELDLVPVTTEDLSLRIIYFRKIPALSDGTPTNWLLTVAPDIYLYASLLQAAPYLHDDERVALWQGMYDQLANEFFKSSEEDDAGGAPLVVRGPSFY